jgi:hypothetical protein
MSMKKTKIVSDEKQNCSIGPQQQRMQKKIGGQMKNSTEFSNAAKNETSTRIRIGNRQSPKGKIDGGQKHSKEVNKRLKQLF